MSVHPGRWQWQPSSESRWEWMPPETSSQLSAFQSEGLLTVQWQPFGDVEVDVGAGVAHLQGQQLGKVRQVPNWWGADANLAAGVLAACQVQDRGEVEFLLGVESRPWWPTRQVGPLWGFVEPDDRGLTSAMAREAFEESLGVLGSQDQLQACLDSEASAPVSFWPWQSQGRRSPQPAVLRMVNLGSLSHGQQDAVRESFRKRRHRALAAASLAVLATATGPTGSAQPSQPPASHLEVEELIWVNSQFLLQKVEAQRHLKGSDVDKLESKSCVTICLNKGFRKLESKIMCNHLSQQRFSRSLIPPQNAPYFWPAGCEKGSHKVHEFEHIVSTCPARGVTGCIGTPEP